MKQSILYKIQAWLMRHVFNGQQRLTLLEVYRRRQQNRRNFRSCVLRGLDLRNSDFSFCDFAGVDLSHSHLGGCSLVGANLRGADLRGCNFTGADIRGADFSYAYVQCAIGITFTHTTPPPRATPHGKQPHQQPSHHRRHRLRPRPLHPRNSL